MNVCSNESMLVERQWVYACRNAMSQEFWKKCNDGAKKYWKVLTCDQGSEGRNEHAISINYYNVYSVQFPFLFEHCKIWIVLQFSVLFIWIPWRPKWHLIWVVCHLLGGACCHWFHLDRTEKSSDLSYWKNGRGLAY